MNIWYFSKRAIPAAILIGVPTAFWPGYNLADGRHRVFGWPVPIVIWEKTTGGWIGFPNTLAIVLNPIAWYRIFLAAWGIYKGVQRYKARRAALT